jgi:hypothetical protein
VPEVLSDSPSLQEILWNFSRFKDEKQRLTLRDNPHFYSDPISLEAYRDSLKIDPTDDFRHADKFYVLTDKPEPLYIVTDWGLQSFGNFWCLQNAVIFKGLRLILIFVFSLFLMSCQTSVGGSGEISLSENLSEARTMGSVGSWCPPFQILPGIVDYSRLSHRGTHG